MSHQRSSGGGALACALATWAGSIVLCAASAAQTPPRDFDELRAVAPGSAPRTMQVRVRWTTAEPTPNPAHTRNRFDPLSIERLAIPALAPRSTLAGPDTLVVVGEDEQGRELSWRVIADPRLVRAESATAPVLDGTRLLYLDSDLLFALPDIEGTARIRVYKPRTRDGRVVLDALGTVAIP
jgi:hypothetical protein